MILNVVESMDKLKQFKYKLKSWQSANFETLDRRRTFVK